ncbi:MAG: hypothetical protein JW827_00905 [Spirochaetes bacterium]|nr:hypothetical protein [Spirochaetota bacterium]
MCGANNHCHPRAYIKVFRIIGIAIGGVILAGVFGLLFGYFVKLLWNWLMPTLFGLGTITYWQAFGIVILGKLIFGGFGRFHDQHDHIYQAHDRWKKGTGPKEVWAPGGDYRNWKYYENYWKEEGKKAFENYLERMEKSSSKKK